MCEQDIEARRARDLERYHRRAAERKAQGLCPKCGKQPPTPDCQLCEPCGETEKPRQPRPRRPAQGGRDAAQRPRARP